MMFEEPSNKQVMKIAQSEKSKKIWEVGEMQLELEIIDIGNTMADFMEK